MVRELSETLGVFKRLNLTDDKIAANVFNEAIEIFLAQVDNPRFVLKIVKDETLVLNAFIVANRIGGRDSTLALSRLTGFNGFGLGDAFTEAKFLEVIAKMPYDKMATSIGQEALSKQLSDLFKKMGGQAEKGFNIAKGANHQLLSSIDRFLVNPSTVSRGFELPVDIPGWGRRIYDEIIKIGTRRINLEAKGWSRSYLEGEGLRRALSTSAKRADGNDIPGQMIRDFAARTINGGEFDTRWVFSPEALVTGKDALTGNNILRTVDQAKEEIADRIIELMMNNGPVREAAQAALGRQSDGARAWNNFLNGTLGSSISFRNELLDDFIFIDDYSNIRSIINI